MTFRRLVLASGAFLLITGLVLAEQKRVSNLQRPKPSPVGKQIVPTIRFCDLIAHPERYDDKIVRVRASYYENFESHVLYDLACSGKDNYIWPILKCDTNESCKELTGAINKTLAGDPFTGRRTELVIVGRFKDSGATVRRYGNQGGFRFGFFITKVEQAIAIPPDTRWP